MNRLLVSSYMLLFTLLLFFSCGRGQHPSLPSLQRQVICRAEQYMDNLQLATCMDSAYWIGICWNLYQLSSDSVFRLEAEKYMEPLSLSENSGFHAEVAYRSYLAFGKGFDATRIRRYKHEVWDIGSYLLADTVCINASTVEVLLWATAHEGCHCFKDAAEQWGKRQIDSDSLSVDILQGLGILYLYTGDIVYRNALEQMKQTCVLNNEIDSLRLASVYCRIDGLSSENGCCDETDNTVRNYSLDKSSSLPRLFYLTEILLK